MKNLKPYERLNENLRGEHRQYKIALLVTWHEMESSHLAPPRKLIQEMYRIIQRWFDENWLSGDPVPDDIMFQLQRIDRPTTDEIFYMFQKWFEREHKEYKFKFNY